MSPAPSPSPDHLLIHRPGCEDIEAWPAHGIEHTLRRTGAGWAVSVKQKDAPGLVWWVGVRTGEWSPCRLSGAHVALLAGQLPTTFEDAHGVERLVVPAIDDDNDNGDSEA